MKLDIYGLNGEVKENVEIKTVLDKLKVSKKAIYYKIINENFNSHIGTATNKTRSDVNGGGKKPWRQKGTGRARQGTTRSPIWRGGGVVFGGQIKKYKFSLPPKLKQKALLSLIKLKLQNGDMKVLDDFKVGAPKTKSFIAAVKNLVVDRNKKYVFIVESTSEELAFASRNIKNIKIMNVNRITLRFLADNSNIYIIKDALEKIVGEKK